MPSEPQNTKSPSELIPSSETERKILQALQGLQFGSVEIVVHDGKVVQIERKEKVRLTG